MWPRLCGVATTQMWTKRRGQLNGATPLALHVFSLFRCFTRPCQRRVSRRTRDINMFLQSKEPVFFPCDAICFLSWARGICTMRLLLGKAPKPWTLVVTGASTSLLVVTSALLVETRRIELLLI